MMRRREFIAGAAALVAAACTEPSTTASPTTDPSTTDPSTTATPATSIQTTTTVPPTTATSISDMPTVAPVPAPDPGIELASLPFALGVASGDPNESGVVLWTKVVPARPTTAGSLPMAYDIASDAAFESIVQSNLIDAAAENAYTVRVVTTDLSPNSRFWYRFRIGEATSPIGRTRTMPAAGVLPERFGLAVSSCQSRDELSLWDAHLDLANDDLVDLVLWLGDFIYERRDTTTLNDYRGLYDTYRGDERLKAGSAAHPWFVTMDDHEVHNDYTATVDPERRDAAYQAWWEHMPTRLPRPGSDGMRVYRSLDVGGLARILVLDCRQYANVQDAQDSAAQGSAAQGATVLGTEQLDWLEQATAHKGVHTILGSPVLVSSLGIDDVLLPYAFETHPTDQRRVLSDMMAAPSPLIVSGDLHVAMELEAAPGVPEWMAPPLSSRFPDRFALYLPFLPLVSPAVSAARDSHGYLRVLLTPTSVTPNFPQ